MTSEKLTEVEEEVEEGIVLFAFWCAGFIALFLLVTILALMTS